MRFGDEAGTEYIYKEPKVTNLAEIAERLSKLYSAKFGPDKVKLATDSNPVLGILMAHSFRIFCHNNVCFHSQIDDQEMEPQTAYIQITHVTPYFGEAELSDRVTEFERNHNINQFMYETPFTTDGRVRGSPEEQCKRRIVLTSE